MQAYKIDNITIFGNSTSNITMDDVKKITPSYTNQFHLLRHYSTAPKSYIETLVGKEYSYYDYAISKFVKSKISKEDVKEAFETKGSKFLPNIKDLETPVELIATIKDKFKKLVEINNTIWVNKKKRAVCMFTFLHTSEVGFPNLINIRGLNEAEKKQVKMASRGKLPGEKEIILKTITQSNKRKTKKVSVEINHIFESDEYVITAYPGNISPDFPDRSQEEEELVYNTEFWKSHAFIE